MGSLLKNQRNLFVVSAGILLLSVLGWYFGYHKSFSASYYQTKNQIESLTRKKNSYIQKRNQIKKIEQEWGVLNDEFELVLNIYLSQDQILFLGFLYSFDYHLILQN